MSRLLSTLLIALLFSGSVHAGGLLGDALNLVVPGAGTRLDDLHRQIKESIPPYKQLEEGASHLVNEAAVQSGATVLQQLIEASRQDALRQGTRPVPEFIRRNLRGFVSDEILERAVFRVRGGGDLSLQVNAIRYGGASAIALGEVVVFQHERDALYNTVLWVHELVHVEQYRNWGLRDFSIRYLRNHWAVEAEAHERETLYMAWVAGRNLKREGAEINRPVYRPEQELQSRHCGTPAGICALDGSAPVGTPCWCSTANGPMTGALVPIRVYSEARRVAAPPPPPSSANACSTAFGNCSLMVALPVGAPCHCRYPAGASSGQARFLPVATQCQTIQLTCRLGVPLYGGDPCYCPTPMGPVWGRAR